MSREVQVADIADLTKECLLPDGASIAFRPVRLSDEAALIRFLCTLSQQTLYYRFLKGMGGGARNQIGDLVYVDQCREVSLVGVVRHGEGEEIIALGGYRLSPHADHAEVAFVVKGEWRERGVGDQVLRHLVDLARRRGIRGFTAEALKGDKAMRALLSHSGHNVTCGLDRGICRYEIDFV